MHRSARIPCLLFAGVALSATTAWADTLTGRVVDQNGVGLANVRVDTVSGGNRATTLATGVFTMTLNAGTWDLTFTPPATTLAPEQRLGVAVGGVTNLGDVVLRPGFALGGTALDTANLPVAGCNINVYDLAGTKRYTPNDSTSVTGAFSVIVPAGTWRVRVVPPSFPLRVVREVSGVVVTNAAVQLGNLVLLPGIALSGTVVDAVSNVPVANVDIDAFHAVTGEKWVTLNDKTAATGTFSIVVPTGLTHVAFDPPAGVALLGKQMFNVSIAGNLALGTVRLDRGFLLSGSVLGPGSAPVANVNLDVVVANAGAYSIYLSNDSTDAAGQFTVCVPAGNWQVQVSPPLASGLVGAVTAPIAVAGTTNLPPIQLAAGVALSGHLSAWDGTPEGAATLSIKDAATQAKIVHSGVDVDAAGNFTSVVPNGNLEVTFHTRKASLSRVATLNVTVNGATTLNHQLSQAPVVCYLNTQGIPTIPAAGLLPVSLALGNPVVTLNYTNVSIVLIDPDGVESPLVPPVLFPVPGAFLVFAPVALPIPPFNPAHLGKIFRMELRCDDPTTGAEHDHDAVRFIIQ